MPTYPDTHDSGFFNRLLREDIQHTSTTQPYGNNMIARNGPRPGTSMESMSQNASGEEDIWKARNSYTACAIAFLFLSVISRQSWHIGLKYLTNRILNLPFPEFIAKVKVI